MHRQRQIKQSLLQMSPNIIYRYNNFPFKFGLVEGFCRNGMKKKTSTKLLLEVIKQECLLFLALLMQNHNKRLTTLFSCGIFCF